MKLWIFITILMFVGVSHAQNYDEYFTPDRLRLDLYHYGTDSTDNYSLKSFIRESPWSGPQSKLIPKMLHGRYIVQVKFKDTNEIIFLKPYNTLFEEWQDTKNAPFRERIFEESLFIPYPKIPITIEIQTRNEKQELFTIWKKNFDPLETWVEKRNITTEFVKIHGDRDVENAVDIAIIAEGYTEAEMDKFMMDAERMKNFFFETAPFNKYKKDFNFYAVKSISKESGTDLPGENTWKETAANTQFYTFGSERYLTSLAYHKCMDILTDIPHDQVVILVNTEKYGGGGVFNHFSVTSADHFLSEIVLTHEFGHAFGGLADEYYTSSTAYVTHPELKYELLEPNVTNLVEFDKKWKHMLNDTTPIPTPDTDEYNEVLGAFEGGLYLSKGVYRPVRNCRMKTNHADFCPVCQDILSRMIKYYSDQAKD